ncbi:MAG: iron ABC transporter ATP-binding protein [Gammaproteobacteria bacterium]|nr:MAG: iron ABC transporter ATP-binding protein [Gammaproteobacteria bacterium]
MKIQLEVNNVTIAYGDKTVVKEASFSLEPGSIGCLLGPSGCGKTSLLRAIAGYEPIIEGDIRLQQNLVSQSGFQVPPEQRRVGMVFQDFALFPHLSVEDNIAFGLKTLTDQQRKARVNELLTLVGLSDLNASYPHQLSGGQQQRIALIRAMAPRPEILLMDEPFSSIDSQLKELLAREVRQLLKTDGITAILVTHDQMEAFAMADMIGVFNQGRLHQWDSGYQIYHNPVDRFVANFIGQGVMLPGQVVQGEGVMTEIAMLKGNIPDFWVDGHPVEVLLRPDDVLHDDHSDFKLEIKSRVFRGTDYLYTLLLPSGQEILCMVQSHHNHQVGEYIGVQLELDDLVILPKEAS